MQRRTLLKLGLTSAAVLAMAGGTAVFLQPGLLNEKLSVTGREIFRAVGRSILKGSLPVAEDEQKLALDLFLERVDTLTLTLPPHAQGELSQLLAVLATSPGRRLLAGLGATWTAASEVEIEQALQGMRLSSLALRQQTYAAMHDISAAAYFSDESTWPALGYPGPLSL
jgi:hypothetical protein